MNGAKLTNGALVNRILAGFLLALVLSLGAWVFEINADVRTIEGNRFTERDGAALANQLRQERMQDLADIKADLREIRRILEARR